MAAPPLWRRVFYALIPLVLLLVGVEAISAVVARVVLRGRNPTAGFDAMPLPRRAGTDSSAAITVVCLGDSWTFGWGLEPTDSYPHLLEHTLQEHRDVRVANLGNPGASPLESARALSSWLQDHTVDLVVYLSGSNTPMNRIAFEDRRTPAPLRTLRPYLRYLATYRLLSQLIARARLQSDDDLRSWDREEEQKRLAVEGLGQWQENALSSTRSNMARMADLAMAFDFELLVLTYGLPATLDAYRDQPWYRFPELNALIRLAADENGLTVLDMEAAYLARGVIGPEVLYHGDTRLNRNDLDIHPNAAGYAIYAEEVAAWILENR